MPIESGPNGEDDGGGDGGVEAFVPSGHEDEFDDEYQEQQPSGDPNARGSVSVYSVISGDRTASSRQMLDLAFDCQYDPSASGTYSYEVEYFTIAASFTAHAYGFLNPTRLWAIGGVLLADDPRDGTGTRSGTITVQADVVALDPAQGDLAGKGTSPVTIDYSATPGTLIFTTHPTDGNFEVTVTFGAYEDLLDPNSGTGVTRALHIVGQRVTASPGLIAARRACARGFGTHAKKLVLQRVTDLSRPVPKPLGEVTRIGEVAESIGAQLNVSKLAIARLDR